MDDLHPKTRKRYFHVVEPTPTFLDVYGSYRRLSSELKWLNVINPQAFRELTYELKDEKNVYILWHDQKVPPDRKCKIVIHYSEMVGDIGTFDAQKDMLKTFIDKINTYDAILVHSLTAKDYLKQYAKNVEYIPIGYDQNVYGKPNFDTPKEYEMVFYGSPVGRRIEIVKYLQSHFKDKLHTTSLFGKERQELLNKTRINLMIPWAKSCSFTSMRLYQSIGSSATLLTEKHETYPAEAGKHYVQIEDFDDQKKTIEQIEEALSKDLTSISKQAHEDLSKVDTKQSMNMLLAYLASI